MSAAALLSASAAYAADWVPLGEDARGNAWHLDMASIVREDNMVTAWKRIDFRREYPHFLNGGPVKRVFLQAATDCGQRRSSVRAMGLLDGEGSVVAVHEQGGAPIQWPPGTYTALLAAAIARICAASADGPR